MPYEVVEWVGLSVDGAQWRAVMNLRGTKGRGFFFFLQSDCWPQEGLWYQHDNQHYLVIQCYVCLASLGLLLTPVFRFRLYLFMLNMHKGDTQVLFILLSLFLQVHSLFQNEFSTECDLVLPLSFTESCRCNHLAEAGVRLALWHWRWRLSRKVTETLWM